MRGVRSAFEEKLLHDAEKTRVIDTLHKELQDYREGLHFKIVRPLVIGLIRMYRDMDRLIESMQADPAAYMLQNIDNLRSFQVTIEDLLLNNGVEAFQSDGEIFVPSEQNVLKVIETPDPELDKRIHRRVRKGFRYDERMLFVELVDIYKVVSHSAPTS